MKTIHHSQLLRSSLILFVALSLVCATNTSAGQNAQTMNAPVPAQQSAVPVQTPPQPASICGSQPLCYEASDFAATITDFRTSTQAYFRVIDVVVRFQNKTNVPLGFAYTVNSGIAMDDRGNRYIVYGANGTLGIGNVYGNNFDPKFELRPGGYGDARFELMWNPPPQSIVGSTFELDLTVREINTVEGNQHTLGGEFPLIYKGLTNGMTATAPAMTAGAPGGMPMMASGGGAAPAQMPAVAGQTAPACGPASASTAASTATALASATNSTAAQNAAGTANTAVSNATAALSSLGSIFGKKKQAAAAPAQGATAAAAPCVPATNSAAGAVSNAAGTVAGAVPQGKGGASSAAAMASGVASAVKPATGAAAAPQAGGAAVSAGVTPAGAGAATVTKAAAGTATATAPAAGPAKTKAQPAKPAAKKAAAPVTGEKKAADNPEAPKPPQQ